MKDLKAYKYMMDWTDQIDDLLASGINCNLIESVFHDAVVERERMRQQESMRKEAQREMAALVGQYMKDRYGDAAERNYRDEDYTVFAANILKDIDDNMEEILELESQGYRKVEDWSDAELAQEGIMRTDGGAVGQRRTTRREATASRVAQNSPEKVLADFVKNL